MDADEAIDWAITRLSEGVLTIPQACKVVSRCHNAFKYTEGYEEQQFDAGQKLAMFQPFLVQPCFIGV